MNKQLKWYPAKPYYKDDNIISSKAREMHEIGFTPSYEKEKRENMNFIMSLEYRRIWFQERAKYEKDTYTMQQIIKEESKIKRRFVQRMMTYQKPCKADFVEDTMKKEEPKQGMEKYRGMKFKPHCLRSKSQKPDKAADDGSGLKYKSASKGAGPKKPHKNVKQTSSTTQDDDDENQADDPDNIFVCEVTEVECPRDGKEA